MAPSKKAMEAARKLCRDLGLWGDPHFDADQQKAAAALDAYAAERVAQASDVAAQYTSSAALQGAVVDRLAKAERERDAALAKLWHIARGGTVMVVDASMEDT